MIFGRSPAACWSLDCGDLSTAERREAGRSQVTVGYNVEEAQGWLGVVEAGDVGCAW